MFTKRAQAAMEFLMTYGWAILVVLAAIGALAYFGVLSPDRFLPEKCTMPSGLACLDFTYNDISGTNADNFTLVLKNSMGIDLTGVNITMNGTGCNVLGIPVGSAAINGDDSLVDSEQDLYDFNCGPTSGKFKGVVTVTYTNAQSGLRKTATGEIIAKVTNT
ncbi:hypothetical protein GOV04_03650 [Candidatus Woesearchaeota archaeon]|nr:hypothetical protein [Candidatus Woesearchaeota archaeon]